MPGAPAGTRPPPPRPRHPRRPLHPALRLAVEEVRRHAGRVHPRALGGVALLGALFGLVLVLSPDLAPTPERDLYRVEVVEGTPLRAAAEADDRFRVATGDGGRFAAGDADLLLVGTEARHHGDDRSLAAAEAYRQALRRWLDARLAEEDDAAAAFPVEVTVLYEPRTVVGITQPAPTPTSAPTATPAPTTTGGPATAPPAPQVTALARPAGDVRPGLRPAEVEPPFPVRSLLLTFAYLVPASLLAQVHGANLHAERVRRRGVLLLSAPLRPGHVVLGKTLPAALAFLVLAGGVSAALGAGLVGFVASLSFLGFLLALTTTLALVARSPRELTLHQVAATTLLNTFLFLPAMFPALPPVAFLSPVHVVASAIRGEAVALGPFLYATVPLALSAAALGVLAAGYAREEVLFSVRGAAARLVQALEHATRSWWRVLLAGMLTVPFVFAAELAVLVTSAVLGLDAAIALFLPFAVLLENLAKGLPSWARAVRPDVVKAPPWLLGTLAGTGFFLAEKGALVLTLVGFRDLPYGREALALLGTGPGLLWLMFPLLLHVATGILLAWGAFRGRTGPGAAWAGFLGACLLHLAYDAFLLGVVV